VEIFPRKAHSSWMWLCFQFSKSGNRSSFHQDLCPAGRGRENTNLIALVQELAQLFSRHFIFPAPWQARSLLARGCKNTTCTWIFQAPRQHSVHHGRRR